MPASLSPLYHQVLHPSANLEIQRNISEESLSSSSCHHSTSSTDINRDPNSPSPTVAHMNLQEAQQPAQQQHHGSETFHGIFPPQGCSPAGASARGEYASPSAGAHLPLPMPHYLSTNKRPTSPRLAGPSKTDLLSGKLSARRERASWTDGPTDGFTHDSVF